jgi:hypothetical protein
MECGARDGGTHVTPMGEQAIVADEIGSDHSHSQSPQTGPYSTQQCVKL